MYKPNRKDVSIDVLPLESMESFEKSPYHPFSYYALNGSDPTGDHMNMTAQVTFDPSDEVNNSDSAPNVFNEHRASAMDVAEVLGTMDVEDIREKQEKDDD